MACKYKLQNSEQFLSLHEFKAYLADGGLEELYPGVEFDFKPKDITKAVNDTLNNVIDDDLKAALGHLGDVLGDMFGAQLKATGKQYSTKDLLPALSQVVDLLIKKGFVSFQQAVGMSAQVMRTNENTAKFIDNISPRQWRAAYNAVAEDTVGTDSESLVNGILDDDVLSLIASQKPELVKDNDTSTRNKIGTTKVQGVGAENSEGNRGQRGNAAPSDGGNQFSKGNDSVLEREQTQDASSTGGNEDTQKLSDGLRKQNVGTRSQESQGGNSLSRQQNGSVQRLDNNGAGRKSARERESLESLAAKIDGGDKTRLGNYHISNPEILIGGTPKVRFSRNKSAIESYNAIIDDNREPTNEERDKLAAYIGWGSFGQELFQGSWDKPIYKDGWKDENDWLREHLGEKSWKSAQSSIINAHYTDPPTVKAIWDIAKKLGFDGGRVLEPSMGIGNFYGLMPVGMMEKSQLTGIELDDTTGGMAQMLYPDANVQIKGYQESKTADSFYDLIIGNWPFAKQSPSDRRYNKLNLSLHDYFFVKALDQVRPGGFVIGITSSGTMDKKGKLARLEMNKKGVLIAAFRMPMGAFKEYAGTSVVADIIIMQKRGDGVVDYGHDWLDTEPLPGKTSDGQIISVNTYWAKNPDNVLGNMRIGHGTTQGREGMIVDRKDDYASVLNNLYARLPENIITMRVAGKNISYVANNTNDRQNSAVIKDDRLYVVAGDQLALLSDVVKYTVKSEKETASREDQIKQLIGLRKAYGKLIDAERHGENNAELLRKNLNGLYKKFIDQHGKINESYGIGVLNKINDPFYPALSALEINTGTKENPAYSPAKILTHQTIRARRSIDNPSIADAFVLVRNGNAEFINIDRVAELSNTSADKVEKELTESGALFKTPSGNFEVRDIYLSGNVRKKLREAIDAQESGQDMQRNIDALKQVIPKDTPYFAIEASLGANWISAEHYRQFIADLLGVTGEEINDIKPVLMPKGWRINMESWLNGKPEAKTIWGVPYHSFRNIINSAFNGSSITIRGEDSDGNIFVDEPKTKEVNEKVDKLREEFKAWAWKDPERRITLEKAFNEVMNATADADFDGSFLRFDGMALNRGDSEFNLRSHQVNAIWRGIANGRGLYAHEVGTGKSYTIAGVAVESRRYGIAKKPVIFAHNANSASLANDVQSMYPGSKVLYIDNLSPATINQRMYQIANDDWDAIVVPHSLLNRFVLTRETLMQIAERDIMSLEEEAIASANEEGFDITNMLDDEEALRKVRGAATAKQLVKQRNAIIENINKQSERASREDAIPFEQLGIDMIIVDESHEFKKPPLSTRMKVKGLNTSPSGEGIAMHLLTTYIRNLNGGKGVHVFTGTPITNTLNEIYNQMRYVMGDVMDDAGVSEWDSWFNTFAGIVSDVELTATGEYESVSKLSGFVNVPELRRFAGQFMDIVFADEMPEFVSRTTDTGKTLHDSNLSDADKNQLLNGRTETPMGRPYKKIINDTAPMSPEQKRVLTELISLANSFKLADRKSRRELMLRGDPSSPVIVETNAAKAAFDVRLYDIDAKDHPDNKVNRAVKNVIKHYKENALATQVIFMEKGYNDTTIRTKSDGQGGKTRSTHETFNVAKDIVNKLVDQGIPKEQIAIVTGSTSKEKRKEIADKMNQAKIRVVIGSTQTLGVGVNMQDNLRAMHHLDAPWMPGELEQRNGRGHRQGNKWNTVMEYRYLTEGIDGRRWQVLAIKQKFITAFLKADDSTRVIEGDAVDMSDGEGVDDISASLSAAAGDPRLLMREKLKGDVNKLENKQRTHDLGVIDAIEAAKRIAKANDKLQIKIDNGESDNKHYLNLKERPFNITIGNKVYDKRDEADIALKNAVSMTQFGDIVGEIKGFAIKNISQKSVDGDVSLIREGQYYASKSIASIEANLRNIGKHVATDIKHFEENKNSIERMNEAAKTPFGQAKTLEKKKAMLADLIADMDMYPVPAPSWLREGSPIGTDVYIDNIPVSVQGHRWGNDNWYVLVDDGNGGGRTIPYTDVMDKNNTPIYDAREFEQPVVGSNSKKSNQPIQSVAHEMLTTPKGIKVGDSVFGVNGDKLKVLRVIKPENGDASRNSLWQLEVEDENSNIEFLSAKSVFKADDDIKFSQSLTKVQIPHTESTLTKEMRGIMDGKFGNGWTDRLFGTGKVKLVSREGAIAIAGKKAGNAQGFYDPKTDVTYLVYDNISQNDDIYGLMLHEIGTHALNLGKDDKEFNAILTHLEKMRNSGNVKVKEAFARVPKDTKPEHVREEALAYLIQYHPQLKIVQRFIAWLRQAIRNIAKNAPLKTRSVFNSLAGSISTNDLMYMAENALRNAPDSLMFDNTGETGSIVKNSSKTESLPPTITIDGKERSTTNSNGVQIAPTREGVENFWKWFMDSKVVDDQGRPLVIYHGTNADFNEFDLSKSGKSGIPRTGKDKVIFFSSDAWEASEYSYLSTNIPAYYESLEQNKNLKGVARDQLAQDAARAGKNVIPVYLNLINPIFEDVKGRVSTNKDRIKKIINSSNGDGIILKNVRSFNDEQHATTHYIAFNPNQIKSATGNTGAFSPSNNDIRYSIFSTATDSIRNVAHSRQGAHPLGWLGGFFQRNHLIDFALDYIRELIKPIRSIQGFDPSKSDGVNLNSSQQAVYDEYQALNKAEQYAYVIERGLKDYKHFSQEKDNIINGQDRDIDKKYKEMRKLMTSAEAAELGRVQAMATRDGTIDPEKVTNSQYNTLSEERKLIVDAYRGLSEGAKKAYVQMRDDYQNDLIRKRDALQERIKAFDFDSAAKTKILLDIQQQFDMFINPNKGVYFPLSRFGDHVLVGKLYDENGDEIDNAKVVSFFENIKELDAAVKQLSEEGYETEVFTKKKYLASEAQGNAANDIAVITARTLEQMRDGGLDINDTEVLDEINQLLINALPDVSYRKHFIHRKGTLGFSTDTLRAYANTRHAAGRAIASIQTDHKISGALRDAEKASDKLKTGQHTDKLALSDAINELKLREEKLKQSDVAAWAQTMTSLGFFGALGFNISSAATNLMQVPGVAFPELAGKFGTGKAFNALKTAYSLMFDKNVLDVATGFNLINHPELQKPENARLKAALKRLADTGKIDLTQTHDAVAMGRNASYSDNVATRFIDRLGKYSGYMFHVAEAVNRQIVAIAAFNLAMEKHGDFERAYEETVDAIDRTQFDYSQGNRARYMMGNASRVLTLFKAYALGISYYLGRVANQAIKGATAEERLAARKTMTVQMAMTFATSGLFGLPIGMEAFTVAGGVVGFKQYGAKVGAVGGAIAGNLLFRLFLDQMGVDDDDDLEHEFRNWVADEFGQTPAEFLSKGPMRLLGIDVSGRLGLDSIWWRQQNKELEGRDEFNAYMNALLGPIGSQVMNYFIATQLWKDGNEGRAFESVSPAAARNFVAAYRMHDEGVTTMKGDKIIDRDLSAWELFSKAFGFNPAVVADVLEANSAIKKKEIKIANEKRHLLNRYFNADNRERVELLNSDIKDFNATVPPSERITKQSIVKSMQSRKSKDKRTKNGLYMSGKREYLRSEGRFAQAE